MSPVSISIPQTLVALAESKVRYLCPDASTGIPLNPGFAVEALIILSTEVTVFVGRVAGSIVNCNALSIPVTIDNVPITSALRSSTSP